MSKHVPPELAALLRESFSATSHLRKETAKPVCSKMYIDRIYPTTWDDIFIYYSNNTDNIRRNTLTKQILEKFIDNMKSIIV